MFKRLVDVQRISQSRSLPSDAQLQCWVETALLDYPKDAEILIRIVEMDEMSRLNHQYRNKQGATNILSFPLDLPKEVEGIDLLGDLVVCAAVLKREAQQQQKLLHSHWAHIIIHGVLHLLGYDHINQFDAQKMEDKEIVLLQKLQITSPYQEKEVNEQ